VSQDPTVV